MCVMIADFAKAFAQLGDRKLRRFLWISIGAGLAICVGLISLAGGVIAATSWAVPAWLEAVLDVAGVLAVAVVVLALFPAVAGIVASLLLEPIAGVVERRHYPDLPPPRRQPLWESVGLGLRFMVLLLVLNLAALPFYLFLPGLSLILFYLLNGYLLGREYFEFAALRRLSPAEMSRLRRRYSGAVWLAGIGAACLASVPLLNFLLPVIATAAFIHVLERLRRRDSAN